MQKSLLEVPALEVTQGPGRHLYSFAVDGKVVHDFAAVSRIRHRDEGLEGYQRPEVLAHIAEIRDYIDSSSPMIPNAIVIAFDTRVKFVASPGAPSSAISRSGKLLIPLTNESGRPGFVVDGQQRLAAIRDARRESFPICVTAFITSDLKTQTEQFILVNSTKPLPKGLIYELLPNTEANLPSVLRKKRLPAYLLGRLNRDDGSPLARMIQTPTMPEGIIKDNSILRMIENSLSDGILYRLRNSSAEVASHSMLNVLRSYWSAVRETFPEDWGVPPRRSRLMHGAGIVSMGFVMDAIADRSRERGLPTTDVFREHLRPLRSVCKWRSGSWRFSDTTQRKWDEIQNTSKDIQLLSQFLVNQYKAHARDN